MRFRLSDPLTSERLEFAPTPLLRIRDNALWAESTETLALFSAGQWQAGGKMFALLHIDGPVVLSFEDGEDSETYGPYASMLIVGGLVRHGTEPNAILARLDQESGCWAVGWEQRRYRTLVVEPT